MISPHTPPGTKIVCIDDEPTGKFASGYSPAGMFDGLKKGETYTVQEIEETQYCVGGFVVVLAEIVRPQLGIRMRGFALARFRYAELPRSILQCLEVNPADVAKHKERSKVRERLYAVMRKAGV